MKILDKIQMYGNPDANYKPFEGGVFYPLRSQEYQNRLHGNMPYIVGKRLQRSKVCARGGR